LRASKVYDKVADSGDTAIEKQGSSIVDTHEPAIAMSPSTGCLCMNPYRNQIFQVGPHQRVRPVVSPGLHHITSVSSHCGMSRNERVRIRKTYVYFIQFGPAMTVCHQKAFRTATYWGRYPRAARNWWRGEGGTGVWWGDDEGHAF
jgi:hypothetical protein